MPYQYRNLPFSTKAAEDLISEILRKSDRPQGRKELIERAATTHQNRRGLPGTAPTAAVKKALSNLVRTGKIERRTPGYYEWVGSGLGPTPSEVSPLPAAPAEDLYEPEDYDIGEGSSYVYAYYYPAYRMLAEKNGETDFQIKVGRSTDYQERVGTQSRTTGMPEEPEVAVVWRTDRPEAAEKVLHGHLEFRGKRLPDAPGKEWFLTSPDEIKQIIESILPGVSVQDLANEETST